MSTFSTMVSLDRFGVQRVLYNAFMRTWIKTAWGKITAFAIGAVARIFQTLLRATDVPTSYQTVSHLEIGSESELSSSSSFSNRNI